MANNFIGLECQNIYHLGHNLLHLSYLTTRDRLLSIVAYQRWYSYVIQQALLLEAEDVIWLPKSEKTIVRYNNV